MALATQCPHCGTIFRVASDQLKLRGGIVRCGQCSEVFDGNASLIDVDAVRAGHAPVPTPPESTSPESASVDSSATAVEAAPALTPAEEFDASIDAIEEAAAEQQGDRAPLEPEIYTLDFTTTFDPFGILPNTEIAPDADADADADSEDTASAGTEVDTEVDAAAAAIADAAADANANANADAAADADAIANGDVAPDAEPVVPEESAPEPQPDGELATEAVTESEAETEPEPEPEPEPLSRLPDAAEPAPEEEPAPPDASPTAIDLDLDLDFDLDLPPSAPAEPSAPTPADSLPADDGSDIAGAETSTEPAAARPEPDLSALLDHAAENEDSVSRADIVNEAELVLSAIPAAPEPLAEAAYELESEGESETEAEFESDAEPQSDEPTFVTRVKRKEKTTRVMRIVMAAGSIILLAALLAQTVITFGSVLAARYPQLKPTLAAACSVFACRITLPAQPDALAVDAGELQKLGGDTFAFATVLHNTGTLTQTWPHIELALTDANDKPLLRRVIKPAEYLAPGTDPAKGFAPHTDQNVKLYFELKDLKASGYHIAVFYP